MVALTFRYAALPNTFSHPAAYHRNPEEFVRIQQKIWQTWKVPVLEMDEERRRFTASWMTRNPAYRYELLTDSAARAYVRANYAHRPDICGTYEKIADPILAADYIRYLAILADGGLYTDVDTDGTKEVDAWIPSEYVNRTGLVVGIEYDAQDGEIRGDFDLRVQLCQWTFMGRAGHPIMRHVVDRVTNALQTFAGDQERIVLTSGNFENILWLTGPRIFTEAVLEGLSDQTGTTITGADITKLQAPKLIGDVLFVPVNAFASGQDHSGTPDFKFGKGRTVND
ncbi:hypothetical protein LTR85_007486 [Meristemomyces frigidus]|nr:hypothetical protein LTR85_007486 [Meristemomyces frigidus]